VPCPRHSSPPPGGGRSICAGRSEAQSGGGESRSELFKITTPRETLPLQGKVKRACWFAPRILRFSIFKQLSALRHATSPVFLLSAPGRPSWICLLASPRMRGWSAGRRGALAIGPLAVLARTAWTPAASTLSLRSERGTSRRSTLRRFLSLDPFFRAETDRALRPDRIRRAFALLRPIPSSHRRQPLVVGADGHPRASRARGYEPRPRAPHSAEAFASTPGRRRISSAVSPGLLHFRMPLEASPHEQA